MDKIVLPPGTTRALQTVAAAPPQLSPEILSQALVRDFGLRGELQQLVSERDQNFRLTTPGGQRFVAKIVSSVEDAGVTAFQVAALLHLEEQGIDGVPRVIRTLTGGELGVVCSPDGTPFTLRVTSWLDGEPVENRAMSTSIAKAIGQQLARLDRALAEFAHPHDTPVLLWDMQRAAELIDMTRHIDNASTRKPVQRVLEQFRDHTSQVLRSLPHQVIHNDANPSNLLLPKDTVTATLTNSEDKVAVTLIDREDKVTATVIDFGDIIRGARVIELATAAAYLRAEGNPLQFILPLVVAYHRENPLLQAEFDVLYDLVRTRLAMTISILYWRLSARDESDAYRRRTLSSEQNAIDFLVAMDALGREDFNAAIAREIDLC